MNPPAFSIIMPTYNSAGVVREAISSIKRQTFNSWELWVIDGVSTDNTIAMVREIAEQDPRIRLLSEKDQGIYDAMNKGIQLAGGDWLYFLGSDDRLLGKDVLTQVFNALPRSPVGLIYGNVIMNGVPYDGPFDLEKLMRKNISHQAIFYSRSLFQQTGLYNTAYKLHADWDLNIRYFSRADYTAKYVDILIAEFGEGGVSASHDVAFLRGALLPRKLRHLNKQPAAIRNIKYFDEWWRLLRNAGIRNRYDLARICERDELPAPLVLAAQMQAVLPAAMLKWGVLSKTWMLLCYFLTLFSKKA